MTTQITPTRIHDDKTITAIRFTIRFLEDEENLSLADAAMISQIRASLPIGEISEQARMWLYSAADDVGCYDGVTDVERAMLDSLITALTAR
jgi:hypothetical protein